MAAAASLGAMTPEMERLSDKDRVFASTYILETLDRMSVEGAALAAAKAAGYSRNNPDPKIHSRAGYQALQRPDIAAAVAAESVRWLNVLGPLAIARAKELLENPKTPPVILARISGFVLDKLAPQQVRVDHHHVVELDHTAAALESLRWMKSMGVPHEKLLEQFGPSGLSRYERMLEEQDARTGVKLIEAAPLGAEEVA